MARPCYKNICLAASLMLAVATVHAAPVKIEVDVDATKVIHKMDRGKLLGTNMGLWDYPTRYWNPTAVKLLKAWKPGLVRIPGGSWSDEYFWNGNGVMKWVRYDFPGGGGYELQKKVDTSKLVNGKWRVDYSGYAPGFRVNKDMTAQDFHGNFDVKRMLDYITGTIRTKALVTVNAGSGTDKMAAEWVRWANKKNHYAVKYWEIGNELEGKWELGHYLPDGSEMTGEIYARRFAEFAKAMKAVDPAIKVGGAAGGEINRGFAKGMLKYSGNLVDFVSFHHYPEKRSLVDDKTLFGHIFQFPAQVAKIREMIKKYVPDRADKIEIGVTEWNCKLPEDRQTGDMTNGLWTCLFVGEMMRAGVTFANQWDIFTQNKNEPGGHCIFHFDEGRIIPKSQFWAFWLWRRFMGDALLDSKTSSEKVRSVATKRSDGWLAVMLVNLSRNSWAKATLNIKGFSPADTVATHLFSHRSYLWNSMDHKPQWSRKPVAGNARFPNNANSLDIPPFSALLLEIPPTGKRPTPPPPQKEIYPDVGFVIPKTVPVGRPVEAWAVYREMGDGTPIPSTSRLKLKVTEGKAKITPSILDMRDAAAKFTVLPLAPGHITINGWMGNLPIDDPPDDPPLHLKAVATTAEHKVFWTFEGGKGEFGKMASSWKLNMDRSARRQNTVASVTIPGVTPKTGADIALRMYSFPRDFHGEDVVGLVGEVFVSKKLKADQDAILTPVMQSKNAYWIPLGKGIPLSKISQDSDNPTKIATKIPKKFLPAMRKLFEIRFMIYSHHPVSGTIYFDNIGFMIQR